MKLDIDFSVTDSAASKLKEAAGADSLVRISVLPSGCSGLSYGLGLEEASGLDPSDISEEIKGVRFVSDKKSLIQLEGVTLDWHSSDGVEGFKFLNPKAKPSGGCCRNGGCSS